MFSRSARLAFLFVPSLMGCTTTLPPSKVGAVDDQRTLDEVLAPAPVWEEARPAMESILRRDPAAILIPGSPALPCKLANVERERVVLDCEKIKITTASIELLLVRVNNGSVTRRGVIALCGERDRLAQVLGLTSDELVSCESPEGKDGSYLDVQVKGPRMTMRIDLLERGELTVAIKHETDVEIVTAHLASFDDLRGLIVGKRDFFRAEQRRIDREQAVNGAFYAVARSLSFDATSFSYDGVTFGMRQDDLKPIYPYPVMAIWGDSLTWEQRRRTARIAPAAPINTYAQSRYISEKAHSPIESIDLLDGHVVVIRGGASPYPIRVAEADLNDVCSLLRANLVGVLHLPDNIPVRLERTTQGCTLRVERDDMRLDLVLMGEQLSLVLEGAIAERHAIEERSDAKRRNREIQRRPPTQR